MRLTFKSVDFEQNRLPSVMGVGLFQCRKRNGLRSYEKEGILPPDSAVEFCRINPFLAL